MKYQYLLPIILWNLPLYSQNKLVDLRTTRAVVIGISDYQDDGVGDLVYPAYAALAYSAYLKSKAGGAIPDQNIRLLINEKATVGQMVASMDWLMEAGKEGDRAIFYFAGYGNLKNMMPYDIPHSAMQSSVFPFDRIKRILTRIAQSKKMELVMITDACRAGKLAGTSVGGSKATTAALAQQFSN